MNIFQSKHIEHNKMHYPGTRQMCSICDEPTERCEDDSILSLDGLPLCERCGWDYE